MDGGDGDWLSFDGLMVPTLDSLTGLPGWDFELGVLPDLVSIDLFRADFSFGEGKQDHHSVPRRQFRLAAL